MAEQNCCLGPRPQWLQDSNDEDGKDDKECIIIEDSPPWVEPEISKEEEAFEKIVINTGMNCLQQEDISAINPPGPSIRRSPDDLVDDRTAFLLKVPSNERRYRNKFYKRRKDINSVLSYSLCCTICDKHVGCDITVDSQAIEHPLLKVMVCEKCCIDYKKLEFPLNENGKDTKCRWCGTLPELPDPSSALRYCAYCPFGFCERCICLQTCFEYWEPRDTPGWLCFGCKPNAIWSDRSKLWALQELKSHLLTYLKKEESSLVGNKSRRVKRKR